MDRNAIEPDRLVRALGVIGIVVAIGLLGLMIHSGDPTSSSWWMAAIPFAIWIVGPAIAPYLLARRRRDRITSIAMLAFLIASTALASVGYYDAVFVSRSSTAALIFLYVPLYQYTAFLIVVATTRGLLNRRAKNAVPPIQIRNAVPDHVRDIHPVIERAYRGDTARVGWTHEADLVSGDRTDSATLHALVTDPASRLLIAWEGDTPIGCVNIADRGDGLAYLGLLCIEPARQGSGLGKQLMAAAEARVRTDFAADRIEMTVIDARIELIAWYRRHGYAPNGQTRPFPIPLDPPLSMTVLVKPLV